MAVNWSKESWIIRKLISGRGMLQSSKSVFGQMLKNHTVPKTGDNVQPWWLEAFITFQSFCGNRSPVTPPALVLFCRWEVVKSPHALCFPAESRRRGKHEGLLSEAELKLKIQKVWIAWQLQFLGTVTVTSSSCVKSLRRDGVNDVRSQQNQSHPGPP